MQPESNSPTRRDFLKNTGRVAAVSALAGAVIPHVHAAENNTIQFALIGCGARGTGAADNAFNVEGGNCKLVAMADAFRDRIDASHGFLQKQSEKKMDVPEDRKFVGLDSYKHAMDALKPGDVVILATPLAFRWPHYEYAIQKGLNVFMEKPVTADGPTSKRMLKLNEEAKAKNLKVAVGLNSRHSRGLQKLVQRIHDGAIGDVIFLRGYRMQDPPVGFNVAKPDGMSEVEFQLRKFHSFIWASGGIFSDFYIHLIDHLCWVKNALPVKAMSVGGKQYKTNSDGVPLIDQNFDCYSAEYFFADGTRMIMEGRAMTGSQNVCYSSAHGSKGCAIVSRSGDCGAPSTIYKDQTFRKSQMVENFPVTPAEANSHFNEWVDLIDAIQKDKPYNEVQYGVEASVVTSMGRMAAHTGREVTYDEIFNSELEYAPNIDKLAMNGPAPVMPDAKGIYPIPMPGINTKTEY